MKSCSGSFAGSVVLHAVLALSLSMVRFAEPVQPRPHKSISLYPARAKRVSPALVRRRTLPLLRTFVPPTARSIKSPNLESPPLLRNPVSPAAAPAFPAIVTMEAPAPSIASPPPSASPYVTAMSIQTPRIDRQSAARTGMFSDTATRPVEGRSLPKLQVGSFDGAAGSAAGRSIGAGADPVPVKVGAFDRAAEGAAGGKPVPSRASASPAGFEVAAPERSSERTRKLRTGGFSDIAMAAPAGFRRAPAMARPETQLEILSKPRPVYSEAARRLQVEGEVLLEAEFRASGQIQVLRVIRGLGHGLDENAIQAAGGIRFRPATTNGIPIDTVATVRITFQLAN